MKATRAKQGNKPGNGKVPASARFRWLAIVAQDSFKEALRGAGTFVIVLLLAGMGWYLFQQFQTSKTPKEPASDKPVMEVRYSEVIGALEKYHTEKGVYPKTLREAGTTQGKPALDLLYHGMKRELVLTEACAAAPFSEPCWTGYKKYELLAQNEGKTYIYSSDAPVWNGEK